MATMTSKMFCEPANRDDPVNAVVCAPNSPPCLNGDKSYEKWYQGGFLASDQSWPVVIPANTTQVCTLKATSQDNQAGDLLLSQLLGGQFTSSRIAVRPYIQWLDRYLSNVAIPFEMLFGTPNWPSLLMGTLFVQAGTALKLEATDFSGSSNTFYPQARGFRMLIPPGGQKEMLDRRQFYAQKYRRFLPYYLGPDYGPVLPQIGATALANGSSQQITFTCPDDGDFDMVACYLMAWNNSGSAVGASSFTISAWSESGPSSSFIDPLILPLRADHVFSSGFGVSSWNDNFVRPSAFPGGWGGDLYNGHGQWIHRLHRGTTMTITFVNNSGGSVRISPVFVGYLASCEQGAIQSDFGAVKASIPLGLPGCSPCPPGLPSQQVRVIRAGQVDGIPVPPQYFQATTRRQLRFRGQQME